MITKLTPPTGTILSPELSAMESYLLMNEQFAPSGTAPFFGSDAEAKEDHAKSVTEYKEKLLEYNQKLQEHIDLTQSNNDDTVRSLMQRQKEYSDFNSHVSAMISLEVKRIVDTTTEEMKSSPFYDGWKSNLTNNLWKQYGFAG